MRGFEFGSNGARVLAGTGMVVGGLMLSGCGSSKPKAVETHPADKASIEACHFDRSKDVAGFPNRVSTNKDFCIEDVYPMGLSEVINKNDSGEIGLIGMKIKFAGVEYNCVVPVTQPQDISDPEIRGEAFSLTESCIEIPHS